MKAFAKYAGELFAIAAPMFIGNLGHVLMGATDVFVAAKHSVDTLASIAIANSVLFTVFILGLGILFGISVALSNYRGERRFTKKYFLSGIFLSIILAFFTWLIILLITFLIPFAGFKSNLVYGIQQYMFVTSFSIFGMFIYQGIKEFLQAHEIVHFPNFISLIMVLINLILNFVFVFGFGPVPAMGILGLSLSTLIVRTLLGLSLLLYTWKIVYKQTCEKVYSKDYVRSVIKIGLPIGIGLLFEFLGFNIITMALGRESGLLVATHNILITIIDAVFMFPLAISSAISIKVGFYNGAGDIKKIKKYGATGVIICTFFMLFCSVLFLVKPEICIGIFTNDKQIIEIALPIVTLFALFEIGDGLQISLGGILKGLKMTKQTTITALSSYWLFGIPLGFFLAYACKMSLQGFWIGLSLSLFLLALIEYILIKTRILKMQKEI